MTAMVVHPMVPGQAVPWPLHDWLDVWCEWHWDGHGDPRKGAATTWRKIGDDLDDRYGGAMKVWVAAGWMLHGCAQCAGSR